MQEISNKEIEEYIRLNKDTLPDKAVRIIEMLLDENNSLDLELAKWASYLD
jgi:hypothetical protein